MRRRRRAHNVTLKESFVQGAIGKRFVIKHYRWMIIKTKFPDMTNIKPSARQVECRNRFREAVAYAKAEMAHPVAKSQWLKRTRKKWRVFNFIIKTYLRMQKEMREKQSRLTTNVSASEGAQRIPRPLRIPRDEWKNVYPIRRRYDPPLLALVGVDKNHPFVSTRTIR
jgi:hypothetical protein